MDRRVTMASLLALALMTGGCGILPSIAPDWVANRQPLPLCGTEELGRGDSFDPDARRCLIAAFEDGTAGELVSTVTSIEGDPITRYLRVHANGTIELFVDATRDRFGSGTWERLRCERLVPVEEASDPPDVVFPPDMIFIEDGCQPLPIP